MPVGKIVTGNKLLVDYVMVELLALPSTAGVKRVKIAQLVRNVGMLMNSRIVTNRLLGIRLTTSIITKVVNNMRHVIDRPVQCQSCNAQGNSGDTTPKVIIDTSNLDKVGYLSGSVKCGWCGIEISAPTVDEAIHKWRSVQEIIRLGYSVINERGSNDDRKTSEDGGGV